MSDFTLELFTNDISVISDSFKFIVFDFLSFEYSLDIPFSSSFIFESFDFVYKFSETEGILFHMKFSIFEYIELSINFGFNISFIVPFSKKENLTKGDKFNISKFLIKEL